MKKLFLTAVFLGAFTFGYSQSAYYNDYRSSVNSFNWETIAANLLLSPTQKQQLFALNNQYPTYDSWNNIYRDQPERWSTDRYSSIQRIMGNDKYLKFKNKYYKGQNPVAVYNKNKNSDKRYNHIKSKAKKSNRVYKGTSNGKSNNKANNDHAAGKVKGNSKGHK